MSTEIQLIKTLSARRRPRILYHYTSGSGLIGILESHSIWATNIRFLNDSTEYNFALRLARSVIQDRVEKSSNKFELALNTVLQERLTTDPPAEVYVSSFTEKPDQLSQWRAYCPPAGGYSIGFRSESLMRPVGSNPDHFMAPCVYDSRSQQELGRKVVLDVVCFAEEGHRNGMSHDRVFRESFKLLGRLIPLVAPVLKDPSFAEEQEWRLVHLPSSFEHESLHFREGRSTLVPYLKHSLAADAGPVPIEELVIGPTPHLDLALDATRALLSSRGLTSTGVRPSSIPYRTW